MNVLSRSKLSVLQLTESHSSQSTFICLDVPVTPQKAASGSMVVQGNKNLASEKLQRVRKWSITTYKVSLLE